MAFFNPVANAVRSQAGRNKGPGFYDAVTAAWRGYKDPVVQERLFNKTLADRSRASFQRQGDIAGQSTYNAGLAGLNQRGMGNAGAFLGLIPGAQNARNQTLERLNLPFELAQQDFTEGARRFDTGVAENTRGANEQAYQFEKNLGLALKEMFTRKKMQEDAQKFGFGDFMGNLLGAGGTAASGYYARG